MPRDFLKASTADLFVAEAPSCDACGALLASPDEDGFEIRGTGLLLWSRGGATRHEERPLCPGCAAAIGVTALARWAIEEDEG